MKKEIHNPTELLTALATKYGGVAKASRELCTTTATWYRWTTGQRQMQRGTIKLIRLLLEKQPD